MLYWLVQLTGEKFDLEDLPHWFTTPVLQVVEESNGYYLKSDLLDPLQDASKVRVLAEELRERMLGVAKLERPNFRSVELGNIISRNEGGKQSAYLFLPPVGMRSKAAPSIIVGRREVLQVPQTSKRMKLAASDEKVAKALRLWGKGSNDWGNLYKIWEVIESDAIYRNGWVTKAESGLFTQTANSSEALGDVVRHAKHIPAPPKPMSMEVAQQFLKRLIENWLLSKASQLSDE
jgi:hypothetical protein